MLRYGRPVQFVVVLAQRPFRGVEWTENPLSWPHCNGQAGCWMHVGEPWCWCRCRWCRLARFLRRGGGAPGICRYCGDGTELGDDPVPGLCAMCAKAGCT